MNKNTKTLKVAAPAKINLTLEVLDKREDGFHNIKSVMQAISLYDYLTFNVEKASTTSIKLSGNCDKIPYDSKNLVYKAVDKFLNKANLNAKVEVYLEKNIPVEAGLAGGSTDAAAAFFAMNELFDHPLSPSEIEALCASLGSDLNFCLHGGTAVCTGRGENTKKISTPDLDVTLVKPLGFGISAKEAYTKFALLSPEQKVVPGNTEKMIQKFDMALLYNSLELAVIGDYPELQEIKSAIPDSMMSGSGPTFFMLSNKSSKVFDTGRFVTIEGLKSVEDGVKIVS